MPDIGWGELASDRATRLRGRERNLAIQGRVPLQRKPVWHRRAGFLNRTGSGHFVPSRLREGWEPQRHLSPLGVRQGSDGITVDPQPDPVGELLESTPVDRHDPVPDTEETADLDTDRLNLAVGSPNDIDDFAQIPAVRAVGWHASQRRQAMQGLSDAGHRLLARA